jgi:hypothetical protein
LQQADHLSSKRGKRNALQHVHACLENIGMAMTMRASDDVREVRRGYTDSASRWGGSLRCSGSNDSRQQNFVEIERAFPPTPPVSRTVFLGPRSDRSNEWSKAERRHRSTSFVYEPRIFIMAIDGGSYSLRSEISIGNFVLAYKQSFY